MGRRGAGDFPQTRRTRRSDQHPQWSASHDRARVRSVVSAATGGFDVAFFAGIVNKADGDFIASTQIRAAEDLKGKRVGVQSIGGGVWSMAMLALEHLGLEPNRDKLTVMIIGASAGTVTGVRRHRGNLS